MIEFKHLEAPLDHVDRRQEIDPHQPVRIEAVRRVVGRHHENHVARQQRIEETAKHHRIGDVRDMEFIEAQQAGMAGDALGHPDERICLLAEFPEVAMDLLHEGVKMDTALALVGHRVEEAVHQEALAAADPAPEIEAAGNAGSFEQAPDGVLAGGLEADQFGIHALQALGCRALRGIGLVATGLEQCLVGVDHPMLGNVQSAVWHFSKTIFC